MATLSVSYTTLRVALALYFGMDTDPDTWDTETTSEMDELIKSGLRKFYWPKTPDSQPDHEWSFLRLAATLSLTAADDDYDLPAGFSVLIGTPVITDPDGGLIERINSDDLLAMKARSALSGLPRYCAVRPKAHDLTAGSRYEILVYPSPIASKTASYRYIAEPDMLDDTNLYPLGGIVHGETITEAVLSAAETRRTDNEGIHSKLFMECLESSKRIDRGQRP